MEALLTLERPVAPIRSSAQVPLPPEYHGRTAEELSEAIAQAKAALQPNLLILGHHYQQDEVIQFADITGDSLKLSRYAAEHSDKELIVFCGVHFMAESADILTAPHQKVILPDLNAGCSMADMANIEQVEECWEVLTARLPGRILPITYMNSSADLKAFCARHGGVVCTSSNAKGAIAWGLQRAERVLFFPDEHLGRNTGVKLGMRLDDMVVWDPLVEPLENDLERMARSPLILWKGFCSVHQRFTPEQVRQVRQRYPGIRVIVHPECQREVVALADEDGSTEYIARRIREAEPGSQWAVGTEINLVSRLAKQHPDKTVISLNPYPCLCATMYRISAAHLLWALDNLRAGRIVNQIVVPEEIAHWARLGLQRMLEIPT